MLSQAAYRSGALADMAGLTAVARDEGTPVVWDLCHSVGALPIDLHADGVEPAVGCTYKYLNAGPGAPAFLYVAHALQGDLRSPITGWFWQEDQFAMERDYRPVDGIGRFLAGRHRCSSDGRRRRGRDHRRGRARPLCGEVGRAADLYRAPRRVARAARLHARHAAGPGGARLARVVRTPTRGRSAAR